MKDLKEFLLEQQNKKEFIIIKPGFLEYKNEILEFLKEHKIIPIRELRKTLTYDEAKKFYKMHAKEDFYEDLCRYMSESDSEGILLCNYGSDNLLMLKDEIREKYAKDEMRNCIHSSDSGLNMARESKIYFATPTI